jgi:riboflavin kinase/FMN adenylyltransferase
MGHVIYGQLGRTRRADANIALHHYRAPLEGVFAVQVTGLDRSYAGVANIGVRPTIDGTEPLLEVHLFDFAGNIYGHVLSVAFKHKIRAERRFDSLDELKAQIARDIVEARAWVGAQRE